MLPLPLFAATAATDVRASAAAIAAAEEEGRPPSTSAAAARAERALGSYYTQSVTFENFEEKKSFEGKIFGQKIMSHRTCHAVTQEIN